jgi:uncharacterized membrane protein SpoIIM required for sporulation
MINPFNDKAFRIYLFQIVIIFIIALVIGLSIGNYTSSSITTKSVVKYTLIDSASAKLVDATDTNDFYRFIGYFVNNLIFAILLMLVPLVYARVLRNGNKWKIEPVWISRLLLIPQSISIGIVIGYASPIIHNNLLIVSSLLPHGIIEMVAIIIACTLGAWFVSDSHLRFNFGYKGLLKIFATYVIPLLFIAAIIESYVTPYIMTFFI